MINRSFWIMVTDGKLRLAQISEQRHYIDDLES